MIEALLELYFLIGAVLGLMNVQETYKNILAQPALVEIGNKHGRYINVIIAFELGFGQGMSWPFTILKHGYLSVSSAMLAWKNRNK